MQTDRPFLGILLMLGFCLLAPMGDSVAKLLGGSVSLPVLLVARFAFQVLLILPLVWWLGLSLRLTGVSTGLIWLRTALHIAGVGLMFTALRYLPLADALAIVFVMPFILLLLGHFVLNEVVGPQRLIACGIGFCGTLLVIQPNFVEVGWPTLYPLAVAVVFAVFMLVTRQVARSLDPLALQMVSGLQGCVLLLPVLAIWPTTDLANVASYTGLLFLLGLLGTAGHLLMTWSLKFAPASTLAPMQYLEIPIATVIGWVIFRDLPNGLAALGIAVTIGAGLYIIVRERRLSRQAIVPPPG
jgi:drug/metabolite transporter (DMT)-like permease